MWSRTSGSITLVSLYWSLWRSLDEMLACLVSEHYWVSGLLWPGHTGTAAVQWRPGTLPPPPPLPRDITDIFVWWRWSTVSTNKTLAETIFTQWYFAFFAAAVKCNHICNPQGCYFSCRVLNIFPLLKMVVSSLQACHGVAVVQRYDWDWWRTQLQLQQPHPRLFSDEDKTLQKKSPNVLVVAFLDLNFNMLKMELLQRQVRAVKVL